MNYPLIYSDRLNYIPEPQNHIFFNPNYANQKNNPAGSQSAVVLVLRDSSVSISFLKKSGPYLLFSHSILSSLSFPNPLSFLHPLTSITGSGEPRTTARGGRSQQEVQRGAEDDSGWGRSQLVQCRQRFRLWQPHGGGSSLPEERSSRRRARQGRRDRGCSLTFH